MAIIYSANVANVIYINAHDGGDVSFGTSGHIIGGKVFISQSMIVTAPQARAVAASLTAAADALDATKDGAP